MTMPSIRRVWVTRTAPAAHATGARLKAMGFEPVVVPLLQVGLVPVRALPDHAAVAFTSMNGVAAFAGLSQRRDQPVFAVGEATAQAARLAGWTEVRSADGDIDALARLIAEVRPQGPLLVPGAREPAGDLPRALAGRIAVVPLPVYAAVETGAAAPDFDAVLVHSPRAARALARLHGPALRGRVAVALAPPVAEPLGRLDLADLRVAAAPTEADLLAALGKAGPPV